MKKLIALVLACVMVVALCACGAKTEAPAAAPAAAAEAAPAAEAAAEAAPAVDDTVYEMNLYHIFPDPGHEHTWLTAAAEEIKTQTNGKVIVNVIGGGVMGGEDELIPQVLSGALDMTMSGASVWGTNLGIDAIGWSELPYVAASNMKELCAFGEITPELINKQLEANGTDLYCLGTMSQAMRNLATASKEVHTVEDVKGLKIRVPMSDVYISIIESWAGSATGMSSSEVCNSLANGTIDGFEGDPASIISRGQQDFIKYYCKTGHIAALNALMISKTNLAKLPAEYQQIVKDVFYDFCVKQCYDRVEADATELQKMIDAGVTVYEPTAEEMAGFQAAALAYTNKWVEDQGVQDIVAEAQEYVKNNTK